MKLLKWWEGKAVEPMGYCRPRTWLNLSALGIHHVVGKQLRNGGCKRSARFEVGALQWLQQTAITVDR